MKTLYLECAMGAAGDMLAGALLELYGDREGFLDWMNGLGIPGVFVSAEDGVRGGIAGTRFRVAVHGAEEGAEDAGGGHGHGPHGHRAADPLELLGRLPVPERVREDAKAVYDLVARAESRVHGVPVAQVHLHELGALDALADIVAVCALMARLAPDRVTASPVHVGTGTVRCAHGVLPVPAPATALLLEGVPICGGEVAGELCTPTGAALLRHFAADFGPLPAMRLTAVGCGLGAREFQRPNCLRALLGETAEAGGREQVRELCCNLDDMTPEAVGFALEMLLESGALDAWTVPVGMKKSRPGVQLCCMCRQEDADRLEAVMFRHTTTLGIREYAPARHVLARTERVAETPCGPVRVKAAAVDGTVREKPEYEDLARISRARGLTLAQAAKLLSGEEARETSGR